MKKNNKCYISMEEILVSIKYTIYILKESVLMTLVNIFQK